MGTGYPYPVPLRNIIQNIFVNLYVVWTIVSQQGRAALHQGLLDRGIAEPVTFFDVYKHGAPVLVSQLMEAEYPMPVPSHVTPVGPVYKSSASVSVVGPSLAQWLARKPSILINLGSHIRYTAIQTRAISAAIALL